MSDSLTYVKVSINLSGAGPYAADIATFTLAEAGFDMFEQTDDALCAYIKKTSFDPLCLKELGEDFAYSVEEIEDRNWNEEWEKNYFQPINVSGRCVVHSSFHKDLPQAEHYIVIDPKMSFGTGHHQTTRCMMEFILDDDFKGCKVLDMGCGTAVLGILALKCGAASVTGVDIDEHCIRNATENIKLNSVDMELLLGGAEAVEGRTFDVVLANINRNILLEFMDKYLACLPSGGRLYISGFYLADLPILQQKADALGADFTAKKCEDDWTAAKFVKR